MNSEGLIKQAIYSNIEIEIEYLYGLQSDKRTVNEFTTVHLQPYIYGDDIFQYSFVWGYLPDRKVCYKFLLDNIRKVVLTKTNYKVVPEVSYQYSLEEEHYDVLQGFRRIYAEEAAPIDNGKK